MRTPLSQCVVTLPRTEIDALQVREPPGQRGAALGAPSPVLSGHILSDGLGRSKSQVSVPFGEKDQSRRPGVHNSPKIHSGMIGNHFEL